MRRFAKFPHFRALRLRPGEGRCEPPQRSRGSLECGSNEHALEVPAHDPGSAFIGSTLERLTLTVHYKRMACTTLFCLRSGMPHRCSRWSHARSARGGSLRKAGVWQRAYGRTKPGAVCWPEAALARSCGTGPPRMGLSH